MAKKLSKIYNKPLKPRMVDLFVLNVCYREKRLDLALEYFDFIKSKAEEDKSGPKSVLKDEDIKSENVVTESKAAVLFRLIYEHPKPLTEEEEKSVLRVTRDVKGVSWGLVGALAKTSKFEAALKMAEKFKFGDLTVDRNYDIRFPTNSVAPMAVLIKKLFEAEDKVEDAFRTLKSPFFHCYRNSLRFNQTGEFENLVAEIVGKNFLNVDQVGEFFAASNYFMTKRIAEAVRKAFKGAFEAKVDRLGACSKSESTLPSAALTSKNLLTLTTLFEKRVVNAFGSIYTTTIPAEFEDFKAFISAEEYDVVVDALNVALVKTYTGRDPPHKLLEGAVYQLKNRLGFKRPLLVMRSHQQRMRNFEEWKSDCAVYVLRNDSQDDPLMLMAAMNKDVPFVSNDNMTTHRNHLRDPEVMWLFDRWQMMKQIRHSRDMNKTQLTLPPLHVVEAVLANDTWHLPIARLRMKKFYHERHNLWPPETWLCIKRT